MAKIDIYNANLCNEQFLFYEMRIVAKLMVEGLSEDEIITRVKEENLFQKPTERKLVELSRNCLRRLNCLDIDTIGEAMMTEDKVFEACQSAMAEIKNLVRIITNELNGTNILITADHGFLYSYKPLTVSDKAEKDYVTGLLIETDRRYIISDNGASGEHLLRIPMQDYQCDYYLMVPQDNIRFKTGGGMNYVHGGVSLQEMMVPVITFKNMRATNKKFVESSKAKVELISSGRKVSNNMFSLNFYQKEAVGGKVAACTYNVFFTDAAGKPISDVKTIIADKTSDNGSDRVFRVRFTLKGQEFKKTEEYYLTIMEKDGSGVPEKIAFTIDIAFANDFDF